MKDNMMAALYEKKFSTLCSEQAEKVNELNTQQNIASEFSEIAKELDEVMDAYFVKDWQPKKIRKRRAVDHYTDSTYNTVSVFGKSNLGKNISDFAIALRSSGKE